MWISLYRLDSVTERPIISLTIKILGPKVYVERQVGRYFMSSLKGYIARARCNLDANKSQRAKRARLSYYIFLLGYLFLWPAVFLLITSYK